LFFKYILFKGAEKMNYKKIGNNIRKIRQKQELTIEEAASIIGVSSNFLGKIERAQSVMSLETLVKIANGLNVTTDDILSSELDNISSSRVMKNNENLNLIAHKNPEIYKLIELIMNYTLEKDNDREGH
jgi:Predicted transcriptional regulators